MSRENAKSVDVVEGTPVPSKETPSIGVTGPPSTTSTSDIFGHQPGRQILALDLSLTATGIALPRGNLGTFKPTTERDRRLLEIVNTVADLTALWTPDLVVIEDLPTGLRNAAAGSLGMCHGAVRVEFMRHRIPYLTVPPATLKTYATGRGNATKPDLRMELFKRTGLDMADDNQVDAWWLRALALDLAGQPLLELPQSHRRALTKLVLPEEMTS